MLLVNVYLRSSSLRLTSAPVPMCKPCPGRKFTQNVRYSLQLRMSGVSTALRICPVVVFTIAVVPSEDENRT